MSQTQVKLRFSSLQDLWKFAQRIKAVNIEINTRERTLICDCNELEVGLATDEFSAVVVRP